MLSYSFYLAHWPVLIIASERQGSELSVAHNLLLLLVALAISAVTFVVLEHPVRSWSFLRRRNVLSLALGCALIALSISVSDWTISRHAGPF
jgi:peptidoglycan/LPS O-acetylase OafA/YrhL